MLNRRRFIGFAAGAAAGAVVGRHGGDVLAGLAAEIDRPIYPPRGIERYKLSTCAMCPGGCGVRVRCIGERPVKLDGNPLHPVSGGRLCPKGQASLQALLHPDRLRRPLRRAGPRGRLDSFRETTWEEALDEVAVRLALLRRQERPEALALVRGPSRGVGARIATRFLAAFGSPNDVLLQRGDDAARQALALTQGVDAVPAYDIQAAEYVLSVGSALLEASSSPVHAMRAFGEFRQGRQGRRGRLVHVGPRRSVTAVAADAYVPIRPGTEGLMAMGVASVLVAEDLYDKEFVAHHVHQFEDYVDESGRAQPGLVTLLRREFPLGRVSAETGVSVNRILEIAREFAGSHPAVAIGPRGGPLLSGPLFDHLATHALNALVGNIDGPGGVLVPEEVPLPEWLPAIEDSVAETGRARPRLDGVSTDRLATTSDPEALADAFFAQVPYKAEALLVLDADPAFASMAPDQFAAALEQVPLVVSLASLPNDTCLHSDWILPLAHPLESWDLDITPSGVPYPMASLARPALGRPKEEARPAADVLLELARRIGGPVAEALPFDDGKAAIRAEVNGLYAAKRGAVIGTEFDEAWVRLMEQAGWWAPGYRSENELWTRIQETGGWWDPFYDHWHWKRVLATPSGRLELRPTELASLADTRRERLDASLDEEHRQAPQDRSLALQLFEPLPLSGGVGAELPFLQQALDTGHGHGWESWVDLHIETADTIGVRDRDLVRVASSRGDVVARARVGTRVIPDVAAMPIGLGKRAGGRWARGRGANPLSLLPPTREDVSGLPDLGGVRVRIQVVKRATRPSAGEEV